MRTCAVCHATLETPLDEYGDRDDPVCRSCWLLMSDHKVGVFPYGVPNEDWARFTALAEYFVMYYD